MSNVLSYKGYQSKLETSIEEGILYGKIEGISDLINFEGETIAEAKEAFEESVDDYLEFCKEVGKEPDKVYKGSFNIRIDPELHKKGAGLALRCGVSLNQVVEKAIESYIESYDVFEHHKSNKIKEFSELALQKQVASMWASVDLERFSSLMIKASGDKYNERH